MKKRGPNGQKWGQHARRYRPGINLLTTSTDELARLISRLTVYDERDMRWPILNALDTRLEIGRLDTLE